MSEDGLSDTEKDRSERLRERRQNVRERGTDVDDTDPGVDTDSPDESGADESTPDAGGSIREERTGMYVYLSDPQTEEVERLYKTLQAEYEFEMDREFQKNRDFYPLLVEYGASTLEGCSPGEIDELLSELRERLHSDE